MPDRVKVVAENLVGPATCTAGATGLVLSPETLSIIQAGVFIFATLVGAVYTSCQLYFLFKDRRSKNGRS
jgi:hypothetical protein